VVVDHQVDVGAVEIMAPELRELVEAVSADGSIVVGKGDGTESKPFIWDAINGMRSLSTVLTDLGLDLTGWDLRTATGISADGSTIVGDGVNNGVDQAWIAVIPEPGTGLLLMSGLLGLAAWGRRIAT
jgi:hypothetical protein